MAAKVGVRARIIVSFSTLGQGTSGATEADRKSVRTGREFQLLTVQKLTNKEESYEGRAVFQVNQEGSDIIVNTAIEKAKELNRS